MPWHMNYGTINKSIATKSLSYKQANFGSEWAWTLYNGSMRKTKAYDITTDCKGQTSNNG